VSKESALAQLSRKCKRPLSSQASSFKQSLEEELRLVSTKSEKKRGGQEPEKRAPKQKKIRRREKQRLMRANDKDYFVGG
jgi:hypothetical protein